MRAPIPWKDAGWRTAEEILASDESALRSARPCILVSRFSGPALTLGVSQQLSSAILDRARAEGVEVVRRGSGGRAILHARGDLAWSIVLPRADPRVGRDFVRSYGRMGRGIVEALRGSGVEASWSPSGQSDPELCLLAERGEVLWVRERVVGGAAQHLTGRALLHHGCLAVRAPEASTARLFSRSAEELARHLAGLEQVATISDPERLARGIGEALSAGPAIS